ncbi:putative dienelactone hydrolase [Cryobacterium sp. CAN_C3]|uniref:alpha/beta hydrolase family protein n=1 Tax=unclassified Cryobacterium TaxID=2649013 RepID=UPI0018CACE70|nr:alpha/beta hydrolase [Cryobacterium sp. CAN_C3]MEC5155611.1 putative dienelactone hydrolase [Cryobacterium sp. CAN_C3]
MTFDTISITDPSRTSWSNPHKTRPQQARIWAVQGTTPAPVVVLSHGTGGAGEDLDWLAAPLNDAGYLVATIDHHGNSYNDEYLVEGFTFPWERAQDVRVLLDHLVAEHDVDVNRIGAAGFSFGGYTVAALLGARIDPAIMAAMFQGHIPAPNVPEFPDLIEALRTKYTDAELAAIAQAGSASMKDTRVRAGVLLAPGIGRLLAPESLQQIVAPVLLRWGDADENTSPGDNALVYRDLIPHAVGRTLGPDVGHYIFLGNRDDPGKVRTLVASEVLEFFNSHL